MVAAAAGGGGFGGKGACSYQRSALSLLPYDVWVHFACNQCSRKGGAGGVHVYLFSVISAEF